MKIRVSEVISDANTIRVSFHSPVGSGTALWMGISPAIGEEQDVELDLDEVFTWGKNIIPSSRKTPKINIINGLTQITAQIIQNPDGEWTALKLGDSIVLIELDELPTQKSGFVELKATKIHLYPTSI
ncbi:hypothetical protein C9383_15135 [Pseudomonas palleroniana]|uniref:Uncharacterized protein n=1 Tax=Pseudomonas palleroniana TaxID=191390 RepID=A0A1H5PDR2_9PSED|nr:hypothetical protein [Pseudomonas palleroniana]KAB0563947.1 hypothetical protein F7R03_24765 [Pseudomonas palleroniana]PTC25698.1 hypothetical protein C9383_15135 [Pseudomonas palleroniana]SEF11191.1 hypothetical protein SAMN04490198_5604 [Pseudomonas palleroniana]